jgi:putative transposase
MAPISYRRHRFPPVVIQRAVWLYLRFTLSYRDVEELLAERGLGTTERQLLPRFEAFRPTLKFLPNIPMRNALLHPRPTFSPYHEEIFFCSM